MNTVSPDQVESTRRKGARLNATILQRLSLVTQEFAADCMGVSSSTVSRQKEDLERFCQLLAAVGLQVTPTDSVVVSKDEMVALESMALKYLEAKAEARRTREAGHDGK